MSWFSLLKSQHKIVDVCVRTISIIFSIVRLLLHLLLLQLCNSNNWRISPNICLSPSTTTHIHTTVWDRNKTSFMFYLDHFMETRLQTQKQRCRLLRRLDWITLNHTCHFHSKTFPGSSHNTQHKLHTKEHISTGRLD